MSDTRAAVIEPVLKQHYEDIERVFMMRGTAKTLNTKGVFDERIVVAGTHRCYVFQVGGKLEFDVHYMDIISLSTTTRARVRIEYRPPNSTDPKKTNELVIQPSSFASFDIDFFVQAVCQAYQSNFTGMPRDLKFKLEISPDARKQQILNGIAIPGINMILFTLHPNSVPKNWYTHTLQMSTRAAEDLCVLIAQCVTITTHHHKRTLCGTWRTCFTTMTCKYMDWIFRYITACSLNRLT